MVKSCSSSKQMTSFWVNDFFYWKQTIGIQRRLVSTTKLLLTALDYDFLFITECSSRDAKIFQPTPFPTQSIAKICTKYSNNKIRKTQNDHCLFEKKPFQFWQDIWIQLLVILLQLYRKHWKSYESFQLIGQTAY